MGLLKRAKFKQGWEYGVTAKNPGEATELPQQPVDMRLSLKRMDIEWNLDFGFMEAVSKTVQL